MKNANKMVEEAINPAVTPLNFLKPSPITKKPKSGSNGTIHKLSNIGANYFTITTLTYSKH